MEEEYNNEVMSDGDYQEDEFEIVKKRVRRVSDVIDSIGERDDEFVLGSRTPRTSETEREVDSPEQCLATSMTENIFSPDWLVEKKPSDLLDAGPFTPSPEDDAIESIQSSVQSSFSAKMVVERDAECYNMNHAKRGKCIVFNHEIFDTGFEARDGSTIDAKRIEKTFTNLGFEVEVLDNLEHSQVMKKIKKLSEEDHSDNDCLCIFMLTHGLAPDLIFAKDVAYQAEKIWKPFTADKCMSLAGKPKLFFFQACRGNELDAGVQLNYRRMDALRTETDSSLTAYKIPTHADFLIAHSTVQGQYSWRSPTAGTWFIQCLCDVMDAYHKTTDLQKMLTICLRRVATEYSSFHDLNPAKNDQKQMPCITSMLIRDVHFLPK